MGRRNSNLRHGEKESEVVQNELGHLAVNRGEEKLGRCCLPAGGEASAFDVPT